MHVSYDKRSRHLICCTMLVLVSRAAPCVGQVSNRPEITSESKPPITSLAFTPDGQAVIAGSQAGLSVHSWPDLTQQKTIETVLVNVHDLAFSPNGKLFAVAGGTPSEEGLVEVFDWPSGKSSFVVDNHKDSVMSVVWIDDASFASASLDHEIVVWDVVTQQPKQRMTGHSRGVTSLCFLSDARTLVSAGLDQNLRVWKFPAGELVRSLKQSHQRDTSTRTATRQQWSADDRFR